MKIACTQTESQLASLPADALRVLLFSRTSDAAIGSIGASVKEYVERRKHLPNARAWDFVAIALSVFAADQLVHRDTSGDGWTREIDLSIAVTDPEFWNSQSETLNSAFRFLTTDRWTLSFASTAERLATPDKVEVRPETSISLLSGGMDSLIGAVDLAASKEKVLLVSQVATGDSDKQKAFASSLSLSHLQLTHGVHLPGENEQSTRSRSIVFISYGILAATLLDSYAKEGVVLRVPENGFVSINPPLTDARLGGLSTRTTHPVFIHLLQSVLDAAELRIQLTNPYQYKTKGEMLKNCLDQDYIKKHAHQSTSCGRFVRTQYRHCGRCVPCLIRRAAFHAAGVTDLTDYKFDDLSKDDDEHARFDDVRSAALAVEMVKADGLALWLGASLASTAIGDTSPYKETVSRGILELGGFLKKAGVL